MLWHILAPTVHKLYNRIASERDDFLFKIIKKTFFISQELNHLNYNRLEATVWEFTPLGCERLMAGSRFRRRCMWLCMSAHHRRQTRMIHGRRLLRFQLPRCELLLVLHAFGRHFVRNCWIFNKIIAFSCTANGKIFVTSSTLHFHWNLREWVSVGSVVGKFTLKKRYVSSLWCRCSESRDDDESEYNEEFHFGALVILKFWLFWRNLKTKWWRESPSSSLL